MNNEVDKKTGPLFKKLGWTGLTLCALCCAMPFIGAAIGIGSLTAIAFYLEKVAISALGLAGLAFVYYFYHKKRDRKAVSADACDIDCSCKSGSGSDNKEEM